MHIYAFMYQLYKTLAPIVVNYEPVCSSEHRG